MCKTEMNGLAQHCYLHLDGFSLALRCVLNLARLHTRGHFALCESVSVQSPQVIWVTDLSSGGATWDGGCARQGGREDGSAPHNAPLFFAAAPPSASACSCTRWRVLSTQLDRQGSLTGCSQLSTSVQRLSDAHTCSTQTRTCIALMSFSTLASSAELWQHRLHFTQEHDC